MTSPSAGFPKTFSTSLENTQSCPCKIRARGLTTTPGIEEREPTSNVQPSTSNPQSNRKQGLAPNIQKGGVQGPFDSGAGLVRILDFEAVSLRRPGWTSNTANSEFSNTLEMAAG